MKRALVNEQHISDTTIKRVMHKEWRMNYKKVSKSQIKSFTQENIRKFFEAASLIAYLTNEEYEIVFVDEWSFGPRKDSLYSWAPTDASKYVKTKPETFSMSLTIVFLWIDFMV